MAPNLRQETAEGWLKTAIGVEKRMSALSWTIATAWQRSLVQVFVRLPLVPVVI